LQFSHAKADTLFDTQVPADKDAISRLQKALDTLKDKGDALGTQVPEDIRRDILCLMDKIKRKRIPPSLRNLFDICYLTEVVLLKRLLAIYDIPVDSGMFEIHLFGGGSALLQAKDDAWARVLGRAAKIVNNSHKQGSSQLDEEGSNKLAQGLLFDIKDDLTKAAKDALEKGQNDYKKGNNEVQFIKPTDDELERGYIRFLKNAQALKQWYVMDKLGNRVEERDLFNVKKAGPDFDGEIKDRSLWTLFRNKAINFATKGSITEKELIIALFSYKMAYLSAVDFYSKG
ncbi:MAG: hypothetical protein LBT14_08435, partial [Treponema sp.]|nr:hypothetical protein [Treponema sp.]